jgi:hypothetical protein
MIRVKFGNGSAEIEPGRFYSRIKNEITKELITNGPVIKFFDFIIDYGEPGNRTVCFIAGSVT